MRKRAIGAGSDERKSASLSVEFHSYGLAGSVMWLAVFSALALFSWPFSVVAVVAQLVVIFSARPV
jgi:hypothetical protein